MAQMPEIGGKRYAGNDPAMKQVWNYIYQLEEQLRYAFNHIGSDNLEEGAVTGKHIAAESVTADKISSSAGNELNIQSNKAITLTAKDLKKKGESIAQLRIDTEKITSRVEDAEEGIAKAEAELAVQAGEIIMKVSKGESVETLQNSAMTLNGNGIEMTTTGHFRLYANDGKNSMIKLGGDDETANFSVTETGKLGAISGEFTEGLKVRNYPVWTRQNIIISSSQPTNVHDVLWIQPLQGVQQTSHNFTNDGSYHFNSGVARSYTLTPQSNDVLTPGGRYEYSLSFPMTLGTNTSSPKDFTVSAVISNASGSVTLTGQAVSLWGWGNVDIKLMGTSSVNLCASSGNITAAVTVSGGGGGNTSMYIPGGKELILTSKNTAASSAGAQTCTIHYIQ